MPPLLAVAVQGLLSDPNMDPLYLSTLVMVGVNRNKFKPSVKATKELSTASFVGTGGRGLRVDCLCSRVFAYVAVLLQAVAWVSGLELFIIHE